MDIQRRRKVQQFQIVDTFFHTTPASEDESGLGTSEAVEAGREMHVLCNDGTLWVQAINQQEPEKGPQWKRVSLEEVENAT